MNKTHYKNVNRVSYRGANVGLKNREPVACECREYCEDYDKLCDGFYKTIIIGPLLATDCEKWQKMKLKIKGGVN
jgi:hypothetical protein